MEHVDEQLQAYLDGRLSAAQTQHVRDHCRTCVRCARARAEVEAVYRALEEDRPRGDEPSLWPQIQVRLHRERAAAAAMRRPAFVLGAAAAVVIGVAAGLLVGSSTARGPTDSSRAATFAGGSLLTDEAGTTLDDVYLGAMYDEGEVSP